MLRFLEFVDLSKSKFTFISKHENYSLIMNVKMQELQSYETVTVTVWTRWREKTPWFWWHSPSLTNIWLSNLRLWPEDKCHCRQNWLVLNLERNDHICIYSSLRLQRCNWGQVHRKDGDSYLIWTWQKKKVLMLHFQLLSDISSLALLEFCFKKGFLYSPSL